MGEPIPSLGLSSHDVPHTAFYTVADKRHFIGAVALLNSLRLTGHEQPVFLVDAGLTSEQREALADHVTILPSVPGTPPVFLAPVGPAQRPADVAVLLDADIVVVRSLEPLIDRARSGHLVGFVNDPPNHERFFPEWGPQLSLGALRQGPYMNAGLFVIPRTLGDRVLHTWLECQEKIEYGRTRYGGGGLSQPFYFADQDVVNAVISALLSEDEVVCLEHRLAPHPPFAGVRLVDPTRLRCEYAEGEGPYLLHHTMAKPWLQATPENAYSRLLPRLLLGSDVALRLRPEQVPLRLRQGRLASADRRRADMQARLRRGAKRQLYRFGLRTRLAAHARPGASAERSG